ncbi:MAG: chemotaxis protein CheA [Gammaproteobacteria bacterium]|nr:chemotaxis protein CheA [Gammaproteobacteria bacterium]MDH5802636.1 chemotaxis protein CheA [Gammaproteobacteria bacterium]
MDDDAELLQDFLVEAGEILEKLGEQLVDLENQPDDSALLNAVFRGFHTIKGGASFLGLDPLVGLCHRAEDVFNVLRNGERAVDAHVMDVILPVLDVLNNQFDALGMGDAPESADPGLLQQLDQLAKPQDSTPGQVAPAVTAPVPDEVPAQSGDDEITEEEFQHLLDSLADKPATVSKSPGKSSTTEEITEEEFERLLDDLDAQKKQGSVEVQPVTQGRSSPAEDPDVISSEEFEALLDELHGKAGNKQAQAEPKAAEPTTSTATPVATPAATSPTDKQATPVRPAAAPKVDTKKNDAKGDAKSKDVSQETTVRVDTKRLDDIMNMVGELVLVRNRMATLETSSTDEEMSKVVANLDLVTADLQAAVMKTRMQPIKKVFGRFPRVVRDLARNLNKQVNLELQGEETDLDKNLVEALADPLVHLVRNAVDHGIETPEEREQVGKPKVGTVILAAQQEGDHILLTIQDDGKGMDANQLRQSAISKGIVDAETAARMEDKDCFNLIFAPGFSTKTEISDVSGRGVGMDVVKTRIVQLNGSVDIDSQKGRGSVITIKVPLTLAIMPTLMVMLNRQIFALPLANVNEIFHLDLTKTNVVDGQLVVLVREKALPLFYLRRWLVKGAEREGVPEKGHVVVVSMGAQKIGFVVDSLIGQEEVVIKPLGALLHGMKGLAGATITGDGRISLILDIPGLMQRYARRF